MKKLKNPAILMVPALEDRFWLKMCTLCNDLGAIIIDLEDSIYQTAKEVARQKVYGHITVLQKLRNEFPSLLIFIRINNQSTPFYEEDIMLVKALCKKKLLDGIMYPKPDKAEEIKRLKKKINSTNLILAIPIETWNGFLEFKKILKRENSICWATIGAEDLCAELNIERPENFYDNPLLTRIALDIVLHIKTQAIQFIGNIFPFLLRTENHIHNLEREFKNDLMLGAIGKVIFHPEHIEIVNKIASTDKMLKEKELVGRLSVLKDRIKETGLSVAIYNGRVVDTPEFVRLNNLINEIENEKNRKILSDILSEIIITKSLCKI